MGVLLAGAGPAQLVETLAAPGSWGDGVDLGVNTCRLGTGKTKTRCGLEGEGLGRSPSPYLPQLFAPRLSQGLQDAKVQGKPN